jgi:hypothetical protein
VAHQCHSVSQSEWKGAKMREFGTSATPEEIEREKIAHDGKSAQILHSACKENCSCSILAYFSTIVASIHRSVQTQTPRYNDQMIPSSIPCCCLVLQTRTTP